jgi:transposase
MEARPLVAALKTWLQQTLVQVASGSSIAQAIRYGLNHWDGLVRFLDDGRIEIDSNTVERSMRPIATRRSLCPPSSSLWKHWNLIFGIGATRATFSPERGSDPVVLQVAGADLVRSARHHLLGREDTILNQAAYLVIGDTKFAGSLGHCQPFASLLGRAVGMNAVHPVH